MTFYRQCDKNVIIMNKECPAEWLKFFSSLNESQSRWAAAAKSIEIGYGGISFVGECTGLSRTTITKGIQELRSDEKLIERVRKEGGGRKSLSDMNPDLEKELNKILSETTAGDPMSSLTWTSKSMRKIAQEMKIKGFDISYKTVNNILHEQGYSLQSNRKELSKTDHPERDDQFNLINSTVSSFLQSNNPVISVDAKKKEMVGNFKNSGSEWRKKGDPRKVEDHDFLTNAIGMAIPYGAYDIGLNEGFVNVGVTKDTAEFAVNSIRQWWNLIGKTTYSNATELLICADGGGSNGSRNRLWKYCLQELASEIEIPIRVCHYPPGTSKWNKIEHRMFSYISINWKGRPLESYEAVINLISNTKTEKGLKVSAKLDNAKYECGRKVSKNEFVDIQVTYDEKLPLWNYKIQPKSKNEKI